jgi:hypothetical protein
VLSISKDDLPVALLLFGFMAAQVGSVMLVLVDEDQRINGPHHKALGIGAPRNVVDSFRMRADDAHQQVGFLTDRRPKMPAVTVATFADRNRPNDNVARFSRRGQMQAVRRKGDGIDGKFMAGQTRNVVNLIIQWLVLLLLNNRSVGRSVVIACKANFPHVDNVRVPGGYQDVSVNVGRIIRNAAFEHVNRVEGSISALVAFAVPKDLGGFDLHCTVLVR